MTLDLRHTLHVTLPQMKKIHAVLREKGVGRPSTQKHIIYLLADVDSRRQLTRSEAADLIERLQEMPTETLHLLVPKKD